MTKTLKKSLTAFLLASSLVGFSAYAEETALEKANTTANKAGDKVKDAYDNTAHEICKKINGKMDPDCVARNAKNRAKTMKSKVETKAEQVKDKID